MTNIKTTTAKKTASKKVASKKDSKLTFTAFQESISLELEFLTKNDTAEDICGNILNQLFRWVKLQRVVGAEGLKLSQPINLKFSVNGEVFNTSLLRKTLQQKLKLQNTSHGRQLYAKRVWAILEYVISEENNKPISVNKGKFESFIESL